MRKCKLSNLEMYVSQKDINKYNSIKDYSGYIRCSNILLEDFDKMREKMSIFTANRSCLELLKRLRTCENVSVLDKSHINKFTIISDFLKRYYNSILLITHIDGFQDYTIDKIDINRRIERKCYIYSILIPS